MARLPVKAGSAWGGAWVLALASLWTLVARADSTPVEPQDLGALRTGCLVVAELSVATPAAEGAYALREVRSTCSCLRVLAFPGVVDPGGTTLLSIGLLPTRPGPFRHSLWLQPEDAGRAPLEQVVTGRAEGAADGAAPELWDLPPALLRVRRLAPEAALYAAPEALCAALAQGPPSAAVVYVGADPAAARSRLPGALALPLRGVEHLAALRGRAVLLVDEGWGGPDLEAACGRLRRAGSPAAAILDGGLEFVTRAAETGNDTTSASAPSVLPPAVYYRVRGLADWHVIDLTPGDSPACELLFPGRLRADSPTAVRDALGRLAEEHRARRPMPGVLIVNETGNYSALGAGLTARPPLRCRLFALDGGWRGLAAYLRSQAALAERRQMVTGPGAPCDHCP